MNTQPATISRSAFDILTASAVKVKTALTFKTANEWKNGNLSFEFDIGAPDRPGRPERPELLAPKDMPRRRNAKSHTARIAMLHAITHIELNAVDLAWDIILRFGHEMPRDFTDDWIKVAHDEARHFELLSLRLEELESYYGALPAHDGLWQSAEGTAHDLLARLAVVPLVLEARGLDVTPLLIEKFKTAGDQQSADALEIIYREEIDHVKTGHKWFNFLCRKNGSHPQETYQKLVQKHFAGTLKPPFNVEARNQAGFGESYYLPLTIN